ncbi:hypothetical protein L9F63_023736, partial [Diploptera punctata]
DSHRSIAYRMKVRVEDDIVLLLIILKYVRRYYINIILLTHLPYACLFYPKLSQVLQ